MAKNKYKHFNPEEHDINVKIAKVRTSSHAKHNINYHIVFIPNIELETIWSHDCLEDLRNFIIQLNKEQKEIKHE